MEETVIKDFFKQHKLGTPRKIVPIRNWSGGARYNVSTFLKKYVVYIEGNQVVGIYGAKGKIY